MCQQELIRQPSWAGASSRKAALPGPSTGAITGYSPLRDDFVQGGRRMRMRRQSAPEIIPLGPQRCARLRPVSSAPDVTPPLQRKATTLPPLSLKKKRKVRSVTPGSVEALAATVQIPRKQYAIVKEIFDEHDEDGDGLIDEKEFTTAVAKADRREAERVGERVKARFVGDKNMGETAGDIAAKRRVEKGMVKHAQAMFLSAAKKKGVAQISLVDFVAMFYPHLSRAAVKRACRQYQPKPRPEPKKPTLDDVKGAREEIQEMFKGLDHNCDGLIRMRSLTPIAVKIGLSDDDLQEWLKELPPTLFRAHGSHNLESTHLLMGRKKSKLTNEDFERLLAPVYLETKEHLDAEGLRRQREFNADLAQDVLYN